MGCRYSPRTYLLSIVGLDVYSFVNAVGNRNIRRLHHRSSSRYRANVFATLVSLPLHGLAKKAELGHHLASVLR